VVWQLAKQYDGLKQIFFATMSERLSRIEMPHSAAYDQELLRELRTNEPVMESK